MSGFLRQSDKMPLCCIDDTIGARIVAVIGLLTSAVVMMELTTELVLGEGEGRIASLLGLSLDEFSSRQRHVVHNPQHVMSTFEYEIFVGFLVFAALYGLASTLLAYASIVMVRWGTMPWLVFHLLCVASQSARLVVQVAERSHTKHPDHLVLSPRPFPDDEALERVFVRRQVADERSASVAIALSSIQLLVCVYMWLVVLVAQRGWSSARKPYRPAPALGDEGYDLTEVTCLDQVKSSMG